MKRTRTILITLAIFGYLQAAVFYWRWGGIPDSLKAVCPLCPNIDGIGTDLQKFTTRTLSIGTANALVLIVGFLISSWLYRLTTKQQISN